MFPWILRLTGENLPETQVKDKEQEAESEIIPEKQLEIQKQKEVRAPFLPFPQRMQNHKLDK